MKKILKFSLLLSLACLVLSACKDDDDDNGGTAPEISKILPDRAQNFVKQHFGVTSYVDVKKLEAAEESGKLYEVTLTNNVSVDFDEDGLWLIVDGDGKALPESILLQFKPEVIYYMRDNYAGKSVIEYDRMFYGTKMTLDSNTEVAFASAGDFLGNVASPSVLPENSQKLLTDNFSDAGVLNIFESITTDTKVYTAQYSAGYRIVFNENGTWKSIGGDRDSLLLPKTIVTSLPATSQNIIHTHFADSVKKYFTEITNVNDVISATSLLGYYFRFDAGTGQWLLFRGSDADEAYLPSSLETLFPAQIQEFLGLYFPSKTDMLNAYVASDTLMIDYGNANAVSFVYSSSEWVSVRGALPQSIPAILPESVQQFLGEYFPDKSDFFSFTKRLIDDGPDKQRPILSINYRSNDAVSFNKNEGPSYEWRSVSVAAAAGLPEKILNILPKQEMSDFITTHYTTLPIKTIYREIVTFKDAVTGEITRYLPLIKTDFVEGGYIRFYLDGNWRTLNPKDDKTPLPATIKPTLPETLLQEITNAGYDDYEITYLDNQETYYRVRFVKDGEATEIFDYPPQPKE